MRNDVTGSDSGQLDAPSELRHAYTEGSSESLDVLQRDVSLASFHLSDVGTIKVGLKRQRFLRESALEALFSDPAAKPGQSTFVHDSSMPRRCVYVHGL